MHSMSFSSFLSQYFLVHIHFDSKHCFQYEQVSTKFTLRLRDVVAAPGIKPCTKNSFRFLLQVLGNGDNREICIHHFHITVNLLFIEIIVTFVTLCCAKQIKLLLRLKTGLHQATLTLAEPLQGPQVGK